MQVGLEPVRAVQIWRLELLGEAVLHRPGTRRVLERKTAGMLAFLALEGACGRSKIAGLLWPDAVEEHARANLRQCLYRLKKLCGEELVLGGDRLSLHADLEVDVITLDSRAFLGDDAGLLTLRSDLLDSADFEDCPDFADWLELQRARGRASRVKAYRRALRQPEASDALEWAQDWVRLEPLSEEAHRALALVYSARGDRASGLRVLRDLAALLARELGAGLGPETLALRELLTQQQPAELPSVTLPVQVSKPPVLVGREREWTVLERAWTGAANILVRGAAGVGKTRLALDFVGGKARFDLVEARPGDASVPLATYSRWLRGVLDTALLARLPDWVSAELARVLPELGPKPQMMGAESDPLRFYQALAAVSEQRVQQGITTLVLDDVHFMDAASVEALLGNAHAFAGFGLRVVLVHRSGELDPEVEARLLEQVSPCIVDLEPLEEPALAALVDSLRVAVPTNLVALLQKHTGGNPLFALETIRSLLEQHSLGATLERLPVPDVVRQITAWRLERRSPAAQRLAQVASVAGEDFTLELGAAVLETKTLDLQAALEELEHAQIMRGERFAHDLLLESVRAEISLGVRRFLHRAVAGFLADTGEPARVARHWLEGGEDLRAAALLKVAATRALKQLHNREAAKLYREAGQLWERHAQRSEAFDAYLDARNALTPIAAGAELEAAINDMQRTAGEPRARAQALFSRAYLLQTRGELQATIKLAQRGLKLAESVGDDLLTSGLLDLLGISHYYQGEHRSARSYLRRALDCHHNHLEHIIAEGQSERVPRARLSAATSTVHLAMVLDHLGQYREAEDLHRQALNSLNAFGEAHHLLTQFSNLAINLTYQGRFRDALEYLEQGIDIFTTQTHPEPFAAFSLQVTTADVLMVLDQPGQALKHASWAAEQARAADDPYLPVAQARVAWAWQVLGELPTARALFEEASSAMHEFATFSATPRRLYAALLHQLGEDTSAAQHQIETLVEHSESALHRLYADLLFAELKPDPQARLACARRALEGAQKNGMNGIVLGAHSRAAAALLELNDPGSALEHTERALVLLQHFQSEIPRAEILWTHHRALLANGRAMEAHAHLERTRQWLHTVAADIPEQYRQGFLERNPFHRAILGLAQIQTV